MELLKTIGIILAFIVGLGLFGLFLLAAGTFPDSSSLYKDDESEG